MLNLSRRNVLSSAAAAAAALGLSKPLIFAGSAFAETPIEPAVGHYKYKVGSIEVTAVYDGIWRKPHDPAFIKGVSVEETKAALANIEKVAKAAGFEVKDIVSVTVYLADTDQSSNYRDCDYSGRTALVVGSERYGIGAAWHDGGFARIGIPMLGSADSLNVAVCASVLLYEARARKSGW